MVSYTDYGRPMKPFLIEIQNFWAWADKLGKQILWHLGYFRFSIIQPLFLQKTKPFYIQIPNIYLGLVFEFGPQRIRDLAFVCP